MSRNHRSAYGTAALCAATLVLIVTSPAAFARGGPSDAAHGRYTVCTAGCSFTSIQAAVNAASSGAVITIGPGHYAENVTIATPVTLKGTGKRTIVYPAVSNPNPAGCGSSSLCGGSASNIMLVAANNVTIEDMKLEGANPALASSGITVNRTSVNARNGIIENFAAGTFNNLTVTGVTVQDIYLRGIETSAPGTARASPSRMTRSPMWRAIRTPPSPCSISAAPAPSRTTGSPRPATPSRPTGRRHPIPAQRHHGLRQRHPQRQQRGGGRNR